MWHYLNGAAIGQVVLGLLGLQRLILLGVYGQVAGSLQNQVWQSGWQENLVHSQAKSHQSDMLLQRSVCLS